MGRIEELMAKYCPDGVEYVKLGDVCELRMGRIFPKVEQGLSEGKYPFYKIGDMSKSEMFMDKANNYISEETSKKLKCKPAPKGTIVFPKIGTIMNTNRKRILTQASCYDNNVMGMIAKSVNERFLYYFFSQYKLIDFAKGAGVVPCLDTNRLRNFEIPLPPLPIQEEIVRVMDIFTELQAELRAELQTRKLQYQYYRGHFFSFEGRTDVEWKRLGEVSNVCKGERVVKRQLTKEGYPVFQNCLTPMGYYDKTNCSGGIPFVICGGAAGEIGYAEVDWWAADDCEYIIGNTGLSNRYIYHFLMSKQDYLMSKVRKSSIPRLSSNVIKDLEIPIPTLEEQQRLVDILDRFDTLVNDPNKGLPAEIEARKQQYEYYRNKLLTFKRKA